MQLSSRFKEWGSIGEVLFWLLATVLWGFQAEEVVQSFCELDFCLPLTEAVWRESKQKLQLGWMSGSFFPTQKLIALDMWMLLFVPLQHHHCNQKHMFFSRGNLWYAVTKQDVQVQISCEIAGLGRRDYLRVVTQAHSQLLKVVQLS